MAWKTRPPLFAGWCAMRARCANPNNRSYKNYGGRGIKVCERWQDFKTFAADVGERPLGCTLDRIDNDGDYELGNVRWSTGSEQQANARSSRLTAEQARWIQATHTGTRGECAAMARTLGVPVNVVYNAAVGISRSGAR